MTTKEFKDKFQKDPERSYIAYYLQQFILLGKAGDLPEYFWKTKNINDVKDVEELYKIKGQIFLLKSSCVHIIDLINKLDFHVSEEFDDKKMSLEEIGIQTGDMFQCTKDYLHWGMLLIRKGSIIAIDQFRYAGANSLFSARIEKLVDDPHNKKHFPDPEILPVILSFTELNENFTRI